MKAHIEAIQARLGSLGWPTPYGDATGTTTYPYILIWSTPGSDDVEASLADDDAWSDLIGVTTVDTSAGNVLVDVARIRALLDGAVLSVDGRHATLRLQRGLGQAVQPDRDLTLAGTNRHPCFQVDRYLLTSQEIP